MKLHVYRYVTRALSVLVCLVCVLSFMPTTGRALTYWESPSAQYKFKSTAITLKAYDMKEVLKHRDDAAKIESIIYPSGMHLPTKYMDILHLAPIETESDGMFSEPIDNSVSRFLCYYFPTSDNKYTFAEYSAANMFMNLVFSSTYDIFGEVVVGKYMLSNISNARFKYGVTNACIVNANSFCDVYERFYDLIYTYSKITDTLVHHPDYAAAIGDKAGKCKSYTAGEYISWSINLMYGKPHVESGLSLMNWLISRNGVWKEMGVGQEVSTLVANAKYEHDKNGKPTKLYVDFFMDTKGTPVFDKNGEPYSPDEMKKVLQYTVTGNIKSGSTSDLLSKLGTLNSLFSQEYQQIEKEKQKFLDAAAEAEKTSLKDPIRSTYTLSASVDESAVTAKPLVTVTPTVNMQPPTDEIRRFGFQDYITVVALLFVGVAMGAGCIKHTLDKRNDPTQSWKR